jgi:hypothetical protein
MVGVMVICGASIFGVVKDFLVDAENYYEAYRFSMEPLEQAQPILYADPFLNVATIDMPNTPLPLPAGNLRDVFGGTRSYVVVERDWDNSPGPPSGLYKYKEIIATTSWNHKGQNKSVSSGILKRKND